MPRTSVLIADLRRDADVQSRVQNNEIWAGELAQRMQAGKRLALPVVFDDGKIYWLAAGFHTLLAEEINGRKECNVDLRKGSRRDAILYSVGQNAEHGLPRSAADVVRAVFLLISDEQWRKQPNTWIGEQVGITEARVRQIKRQLAEEKRESETPRSASRTPKVDKKFDLKKAIDDLPADERAAWDSLSPAEKAAVEERQHANALDEQLSGIEKLVQSIKIKLEGLPGELQHARRLDKFLAFLRADVECATSS